MTARRHPLPPPTPEINLLCEILRGTPRLPGAACRDHRDLFAATVVEGRSRPESIDATREQARAICRGCPALDACRDWVRSTPEARRPAGIVAGHAPGHHSLKRTAAQHNPEGKL
ncbi:WhiB family transcriptional regulator [Mycobacterium simiae]|uniref:WhiB family transcriptional regulator n=1 Tax=Mycobacterium simiae TaxID=1784 RepID=UPI002604A3B5|nr:WhiB family transcriptional regulator [Mycobacterium simiae]